MKNIFKNLFALSALFIAATFIVSAQGSNTSTKATPAKQETAKQAPTEKFFSIPALDDLRDKIEVARANYKNATADNSSALHLEILKAKRLYTVELERNLSAYSEETAIGIKIREELDRVRKVE